MKTVWEKIFNVAQFLIAASLVFFAAWLVLGSIGVVVVAIVSLPENDVFAIWVILSIIVASFVMLIFWLPLWYEKRAKDRTRDEEEAYRFMTSVLEIYKSEL